MVLLTPSRRTRCAWTARSAHRGVPRMAGITWARPHPPAWMALLLALLARAGAQSPIDGFDPGVQGQVYALAAQADGKLLVGGVFTSVGGLPRTNLARLHLDGRVDTNFVANAIGGPGCPECSSVLALEVQPDGDILVGGIFARVNGSLRTNLARLNPDGSVDTSFSTGTAGGSPSFPGVRALALQPDGRILVGGGFTHLGGVARSNLGRLNPNGTADPGFNPGADLEVLAIALAPDGQVVLGGAFHQVGGWPRNHIARLRPDGSVDGFGFPGVVPGQGPCIGDTWVSSVVVQPDRKVLLGGLFCGLNGQQRRSLARLNPDGSLDPGFDVGETGLTLSNAVMHVALQRDGKILVGGDLELLGGEPRTHLGRLHPDGTPDTTFNPGADQPVHRLLVQPDGNIVAGGRFTQLGGQPRAQLGRLYPGGRLDATLRPGTSGSTLDGMVRSAALQPDGRILIGGDFTTVAGQPRGRMARLWPDGSLDASFAPTTDYIIFGMLVQADERILVTGQFGNLNSVARRQIGRLNPDGSVDAGYDPSVSLFIRCMALQPDGKLVMGGDFYAVGGTPVNRLARLNVNGTLDTNFNSSANGTVWNVALQPDGRIMAGGFFGQLAGESRTNLGRLHADGSLDFSFTGDANGEVNAIVVQPDTRILVAGGFSRLSGQPCNRIGRLHPDGSMDTSFQAAVANRVESLALQADGRILVYVTFTNAGGQAVSGTIRLLPDGRRDDGFTPALSGQVRCLALQEDGKVLVGGAFTSIGGQLHTNIARLSTATPAEQSLAIDPDATTITWTRAGSVPEIEQVTFEVSLDGTEFTLLGRPTRIPGGWRLPGLALPAGEHRYVRARGRTVGGLFNGSSGLVQCVVQFWQLPPPFLSQVQALGGGAFQFRFTNTNAVVFTVLASTDAAAPVAQWEALGNPVPLGGDLYGFTDPTAMTHSRRFYQLRSP